MVTLLPARTSVRHSLPHTIAHPPPERGRRLLHVFDLATVRLVVPDEKWLEGGRELLAVQAALLVRLPIGRGFPQAPPEPGVLVLGVLPQPPSTQTFDVAALGDHRRVVGFFELVPRAGSKFSPGHPHDHVPSSCRVAGVATLSELGPVWAKHRAVISLSQLCRAG